MSIDQPRLLEAVIGMWENMNRIRRWGNHEDREGAVLLLASDAKDLVTGAVFAADGGFSNRLIPNYTWQTDTA